MSNKRSFDASRMPRARQRLGKYRIDRLIGAGGFANVYRARDTIENRPVALKVFRSVLPGVDTRAAFEQEARVTARLDHPNILAIKDASIIDGYCIIVSRLGEGTLADRLTRRISTRTSLHLAREILAALAHAHEHRVIHLDVKPENLIAFPGDALRLTDFGIARFALRTVQGSGSGTVGYTAPEQAMGRPSYRSDVFSAGLILWRLFGGCLPEWPFEWPPKGLDRIRRNLRPEFVTFLRRAISVSPARRFANCSTMFEAFQKLHKRALRGATVRRKKPHTNGTDWREVRFRQFAREHKKSLDARHKCSACAGPVSEVMPHCPWCGKDRKVHRGESRLKRRCVRCKRGMKPDWRYCAWCYGKGQEPATTREYGDQLYTARCGNPACSRKQLMPFMRYCPWCKTKVRRKWKIASSKHSCRACGWGVLREYWNHCPWCARSL